MTSPRFRPPPGAGDSWSAPTTAPFSPCRDLQAAAVMVEIVPAAADPRFHELHAKHRFDGADLIVARSGYTGEDGYEILAPAGGRRSALWERLLSDDRVEAIGLGARDSLRLEAGLPLYGHDADDTVSPIEAGPRLRRLETPPQGFATFRAPRECLERGSHQRSEPDSRRSCGSRALRLGKARSSPTRPAASRSESSPAVVSRPASARPIAMGFVPPGIRHYLERR